MAEEHVHGHDCDCGCDHDHAEEEMDSIVVLTDEDGNEVEFEFLDSIEYGDATYVILLPTDDNGVLIMELEETEDGEESLLQINDPMIAEEVYAMFKEKNKDFFDFED